MITTPQAELFVQQFSLMKHFPTTSDPQCGERLELLVDHFRRAAQSDEHGRQMVDWVHQNKRFCPEPVDIWDAAKATSGASGTALDRPQFRECHRCVEGFVQVFQHVRWSQDRAGFVREVIADDLNPNIGENLFRAEVGKYLTSQQHARFETLHGAFPPGYHSRFLLVLQRCPGCWGKAAAAA